MLLALLDAEAPPPSLAASLLALIQALEGSGALSPLADEDVAALNAAALPTAGGDEPPPLAVKLGAVTAARLSSTRVVVWPGASTLTLELSSYAPAGFASAPPPAGAAPAAAATFGSARMAANPFGAAAPAANPPTFGAASLGPTFGQAPLRDAFGQVRDEPNAGRANPGVVGDDQFVPLLDGGGGDWGIWDSDAFSDLGLTTTGDSHAMSFSGPNIPVWRFPNGPCQIHTRQAFSFEGSGDLDDDELDPDEDYPHNCADGRMKVKFSVRGNNCWGCGVVPWCDRIVNEEDESWQTVGVNGWCNEGLTHGNDLPDVNMHGRVVEIEIKNGHAFGGPQLQVCLYLDGTLESTQELEVPLEDFPTIVISGNNGTEVMFQSPQDFATMGVDPQSLPGASQMAANPFAAAPASGGLFGAAPAQPAAPFGAAPAGGGGLFGGAAPAASGGGSSAAPHLRPAAAASSAAPHLPAAAAAASSASALARPAAGGGSFGGSAPGSFGSSGFGAPAAAGFGAPASGGFGAAPVQQQPASGGLFGATPATSFAAGTSVPLAGPVPATPAGGFGFGARGTYDAATGRMVIRAPAGQTSCGAPAGVDAPTGTLGGFGAIAAADAATVALGGGFAFAQLDGPGGRPIPGTGSGFGACNAAGGFAAALLRRAGSTGGAAGRPLRQPVEPRRGGAVGDLLLRQCEQRRERRRQRQRRRRLQALSLLRAGRRGGGAPPPPPPPPKRRRRRRHGCASRCCAAAPTWAARRGRSMARCGNFTARMR